MPAPKRKSRAAFSHSRRGRRDISSIAEAMQSRSRAAASELGIADSKSQARHRPANTTDRDRYQGLRLRELEEERWGVAPRTAKKQLLAAGLPYEGRKADLIYSWRSVFIAEGIEVATAQAATRETRPELFDDLLNGDGAALLFGLTCDSTIRRMVTSGEIPPHAFIAFGTRGMRRFRPSILMMVRRNRLQGRLV